MNSQNPTTKVKQEPKEIRVEENVIQNQSSGISHDNILENLTFELVPREKKIKCSNSNLKIPVALRIGMKSQLPPDILAKSNIDRAGIDLVCVVDVSGSMSGDSLELVKNSLRFLLKIMGPQDRIALVQFSTRASVVFGFQRNTPENKLYLTSTIKGLQSKGTTNINHGLKLGLKLIQKRKYKNPVTCLFLLSDGQDDDKTNIYKNLSQTLKRYTVKESFTINTFGYGHHHDAYIMTQIANYNGGHFHYIEDGKKASEYFVLSLSGLFYVAVEQIKVVLHQAKSKEGFQVSKLYGEGITWKKDENGQISLEIIYLPLGDKKEYMFELQVPKKGIKQINDEQRQQVVLSAELQGVTVCKQTKITKFYDLNLTFLKEGDKYTPEIDTEVQISYLRIRAGEAIGEASKLALNHQYETAQKQLKRMREEILNSNLGFQMDLQLALQDIDKSIESCSPQVFNLSGNTYMMSKNRDTMNCSPNPNSNQYQSPAQEENMRRIRNGQLCLSDQSEDDDYQQQAALEQWRRNPFLRHQEPGVDNHVSGNILFNGNILLILDDDAGKEEPAQQVPFLITKLTQSRF